MPRLDLTDAEHLKKVVVEPLIAALRAEMRQSMRPLVEELNGLRHGETAQNQRLDDIEQRLTAIERFKIKIATISSGIALTTGIAWRMVLDWIRSRIAK